MAESTFRGIINFFNDIGIYDVVLPFLLVFTIVFAILEKTRVLGMEKVAGEKVTRKNVNAMVAFVMAFLVVASTSLVRAINEAMANLVMLLLLSIGFMMLVGSFHQDKEFFLSDGWTKNAFMVIMFVGIIMIFMHAVGWLIPAWNYLRGHWSNTSVASVILIAIVIGAIYFIQHEPGQANDKKGKG